MQDISNKGQKGFSWADLGAAMDAEDGQQGVESSETHADKSRNEPISGEALFKLVKKNGFRCALSGVELDLDDASLDHIIPLSKGGSHDMQNVAVIHMVVNRMKGEMDQDKFVQWCKLIARWNG